ncbi:MAG: Xaa-Pro peptidase family protein [Bacteroidales bacterium]|nr:Xaa-Pro peptidase family protein [Bacteroidales bacterium]
MITQDLHSQLELRWANIKEKMDKKNVNAIILSSSANLFYTAGRVFNGYVYIPLSGEPLFFVRRPLGLIVGNIIYIKKPEEIKDQLNRLGLSIPKTLALEADTLSYNEYQRINAIFPDSKKENASILLREVRSIKTDYEIEKMRESAVKHAAVYSHVEAVFEEGMTDDEMSIELETKARRLGNLGIFRIFGSSMEIFMGSVLAGDNADTPSPYDFAMGGEGMDPSLPVGANGTVLKPGMTLMIDMGGNFTGYMTDMTRTFSVHELKSKLAKDAHNLSIAIQDMFKKEAKPGVAVKDLYQMAIQMVKDAKMEKYFMGHRQQASFIGHGVGIEINEIPVISPRSPHVLEKNMTFALEPKFVIPGVGAVGIENTFLVTENGIEQMTKFEEKIQELF